MIKFEACRTFYHFFTTSLIKFNNTGAIILYSVYHHDIKITNVLCNGIFGVKKLRQWYYARIFLLVDFWGFFFFRFRVGKTIKKALKMTS